MITVLSARTSTQAFTSGGMSCAPDSGMWKPTARPPPTAAEIFRNSRRVVMGASSGFLRRDRVDRVADARVAAAAADVGHRLVDVGVGGLRLLPEQRHSREDLSA